MVTPDSVTKRITYARATVIYSTYSVLYEREGLHLPCEYGRYVSMRERPYEIICTDDHPDWLTLREGYLSATGVPKMLGENPYMGRDEYLDEKVNGPSKDFFVNRHMWHGSYDERHNMGKFTVISGIRSKPCNFFMRSKRIPGLACTIDGVCIAPSRDPGDLPIACSSRWVEGVREEARFLGGCGLVEMKQTSIFQGKAHWLKSGPPRYYITQLQTQLHVTGLEWGILVGCIGSADMKAFLYKKDPEFEQTLRELAAEFTEELNG